MRKIKLTIPALPVSLNTIKSWLYHQKTRYKYKEEIQNWEGYIQLALINFISAARLRPLIKKAKIHIRYYFRTKAARDKDNYAGFKPLLDALKGQVIQDDRDKWVKVTWEILYDKDNPRTEIEVEEIKEG